MGSSFPGKIFFLSTPTFYVRVSFLQSVLHIPLISPKYGRKK